MSVQPTVTAGRALLWLPLAALVVAVLSVVLWRIGHTAPVAPTPSTPLVQPAAPSVKPYADNEDTRAAWADGHFVGTQSMHQHYAGPPDAPQMPHAAD